MRKAQRDAAFTEYVAGRRTELRRFAFALCGSWDRAEDLVQNALVKLYVAWPRVARARNPDAYVRRAILNAGIDESRRPWRRETSVGVLADGEETTGGLDDGPDFARALASLPAMQRKVVVLRHWLDLSVEATAAELGIATGTVKAHHHRAIARLRESLATQESEPRRNP
jgi:RNA polymerase sigma-70 factor (sigma-E family)